MYVGHLGEQRLQCCLSAACACEPTPIAPLYPRTPQSDLHAIRRIDGFRTPSITPTPSRTPSMSPTPTSTPSVSPSQAPSPSGTATRTPSASVSPSSSATRSLTPSGSGSARATPSQTLSRSGSDSPSQVRMEREAVSQLPMDNQPHHYRFPPRHRRLHRAPRPRAASPYHRGLPLHSRARARPR